MERYILLLDARTVCVVEIDPNRKIEKPLTGWGKLKKAARTLLKK